MPPPPPAHCPHFPAPHASPFVSKVIPPFSSFFMAWPKRLFIWAFRNVLLYFPLHTPSQVHSFLPRLSSQNPSLLLLNLLCHLVITCVCVCSPDSTAQNFPWAWTVLLVPVVLLSAQSKHCWWKRGVDRSRPLGCVGVYGKCREDGDSLGESHRCGRKIKPHLLKRGLSICRRFKTTQHSF